MLRDNPFCVTLTVRLIILEKFPSYNLTLEMHTFTKSEECN